MPRTTSVVALISIASSAGAATPCAAPPGVVPVVPESLCFTEIVPTDPSGVSIRQYGSPVNATFVSGATTGTYLAGVPASIANLISYFSGANDEQRNIMSARTTPIAIQPSPAGNVWTANMQVSPTQWPDNFLIPQPTTRGTTLSLVSSQIDIMATFQFNTTGLPCACTCCFSSALHRHTLILSRRPAPTPPDLADFKEACGVIQNSTLPSGYAVNTSHPWSPTYVLYNGQADANFTSECWMSVYKM